MGLPIFDPKEPENPESITMIAAKFFCHDKSPTDSEVCREH